VATATSINATSIPSTKTLVVTTDKLSVHAATTSAELLGVISDETGSGALVFGTSPTLVTPVLGVATATSINATSIPSTKTLVVTTDKLNVLAATTSAELAGMITDETGSGSLVFGTSPTINTPSVGTSLTTASTSFNLLNTTAATVNFAGASTVLSIGSTSGTTTVNNNLIVTGNFTVNGTTTTIDTQTLQVEDKNIVLAYGSTSDVAADGGGITLTGTTNKTFNWVDATDAWTSSEHMNLFTGKSYKINNIAISTALPALTWGEVKNGKSGLVIS
jgi:hypothetical protein